MRKIILLLLFSIYSINAQQYNFDNINKLLQDSSELYIGRIYVEVFKDNEQIYKFQKGVLNCNNVRLGLASSTKWISGAIMLRLAEKGWWKLDDSIGTWMPIYTQYGKGHITLRQSYSMSSGIFQEGEQNQYHRDPKVTLAQSADSIAINVPIMYPTGSMIGYDGTMMHVWGRVAEVIDSIKGNKRDWRTIAKEEFFDLMDMDSTDYTDFYPNNPAVAGGIETTPCDYLKFLNMLSNSGFYKGIKILEQVYIDEMFKDQTNSAPIYHTYWPSNHEYFPEGLDTMRYTFGAWYNEKDESGNIISITSPGAYGHFPFYDRCRNIYGTFFAYIPVTQGGGTKLIPTYLNFLKMLRDEIGDCSLSTVEDNFLQGHKILIYPNPASEYIEINPPFVPPLPKGDAEGRGISEIKIFNTFGECLVNYEFGITNYENTRIDISHLPVGLYFIQIGNYSEKFMVVRK